MSLAGISATRTSFLLTFVFTITFGFEVRQTMVTAAGSSADSSGQDEPKAAVKSSPSSEVTKKAVDAAKAACQKAYCPYSKFPVGAAIVADDDSIFSGCNVENASYGLTICAERNSIFQAVAKGKHTIKLVVVYTPTKKATAPCGACRQVINEFGPQAAILCVCDSEDRIEGSLEELLPKAFGPKNLE